MKKEEEPEVEKEKPNFGLSGKLTEETNKVNGIVIKYAGKLNVMAVSAFVRNNKHFSL